jgi:hypothetical protein
MATANKRVIEILRKTAEKVMNATDYEWGNMGACNCGNLAQVITMRARPELQQMLTGVGDWNDQLNDFCPVSGLPFDDIVSQMVNEGFSLQDLMQLERLNNPAITGRLPFGVHLRHNVREDVALYLHLWADMLEEQMTARLLVNA